ncbi:MAG TPA: hypothetical protein VJM32_00315 [Candidatus Saccharimonadales bacterium]|nr:hypothetical protein [Candidatus Saccharimonadales bacterium]
MGIKRIHHWFTTIKRVRTWQLFVLVAVFAVMSAFFLRQNNLQMIELRNLVKQADETGQGIDIALMNLQNYVSGHMNTDLGDGLALQYSYERAYTAAVDAAAKSSNPNSAIYAQAEAACRPVFQRTRSFPAYTQCAADILSRLAPGQDALSNLKTPSPDLYRFNYASPVLSFDLAGLTVVLTLVAVIALIFRLVSYYVLRAILRSHR